MQLKAKWPVNLFLTALLAYSTAYFVSSLALLKFKPCFRLPPLELEKAKASFVDYRLEKEGFFLSKRKTTRKSKEEVKREVVTSFSSYTLKGTVVCSSCGHSIAILKGPSGKTVVLSEGEELEGYKLVKVLPNQVVLRSGSRELLLTLKEEGAGKGTTEKREGERQSYTVKKSQIIEQISSGDFLKYINIVPSKEPEGLKVNYVNPRSFIYKLGIRPGDVILSINEIRIKSPEDSFAAFEKLKTADTVTITVMRDGKEVKLHYELE